MSSSTLRHEATSQLVKKRKDLSAGFVFLSKDWIHEVVRAIEKAKEEDESFRSLTCDFSLSLAYVIRDIPQRLRDRYGRDEVVIFVELVEGFLRKLMVGVELPAERDVDFTIKSSYGVAKRIFLGELKPATAFIRRKVKVEPFMRLYRDPAFTAKSIVIINAIMKIIKDIPTAFPE